MKNVNAPPAPADLVDDLVRALHPVLVALHPTVVKRLGGGLFFGVPDEVRQAGMSLETNIQRVREARDALLLYAAEHAHRKQLTHQEGTTHGSEEESNRKEEGVVEGEVVEEDHNTFRIGE